MPLWAPKAISLFIVWSFSKEWFCRTFHRRNIKQGDDNATSVITAPSCLLTRSHERIKARKYVKRSINKEAAPPSIEIHDLFSSAGFIRFHGRFITPATTAPHADERNKRNGSRCENIWEDVFNNRFFLFMRLSEIEGKH